ncbi:MAG TPA: ATP-binding cassette domain-containing protein [Caulobacteraceae bacterium]|jgi:capsular polysaccharide transport system ATP-binding protein|nr:ATP-binding cassette domain-containing protein [Caulobacteraceae bacterium]
MIILKDVTKKHRFGRLERKVFDNVSVTIPTDRRVAVLGVPGSGKSTLIYLLAGVDRPTSGVIERHRRLSFPVGYSKPIKSNLSMRQNAMFAARIYDADPAEVANFVEAATGLSALFDEPIRKLPNQVRQTFLYALSYALPFDTYLIDGPVTHGLPAFRPKGLAMFESRAETSGIIMSARNVRQARQLCEMGLVIDGGKIQVFEELEDAIDAYETLQHRFEMHRDANSMADYLDMRVEEDEEEDAE